MEIFTAQKKKLVAKYEKPTGVDKNEKGRLGGRAKVG